MIISNEDFLKEYNNPNNKKIIWRVLRKYKNIPSDELQQIGYIALWNAMKKHNPEFKTKFSTSLYNWTNWGCLKYLNKKTNIINEFSLIGDYVDKKGQHFTFELLDGLTENDQSLIVERFIEKRTYSELAERYNISRETVRKRISKIVQKIH